MLSRRPVRLLLTFMLPGLFAALLLGLFAFFGSTEPSIVTAKEQEAEPAYQQTFSPTVNFASTTAVVSENASSVIVEVRLSMTLTEAVTVTVNVESSFGGTPGTATQNVDFSLPANNQIVFPAGDTSETITITIIDDSNFEGDELFFLRLENPLNAALGVPAVIQITIDEDEAAPTSTPSGGTATPIFADIYESNDTILDAYDLPVNSDRFCTDNNATMWPSGDLDFYRFFGKAGSLYIIEVKNLSAGLDSIMNLYGIQGEFIVSNDDFNSRASRIEYRAPVDGFYFVLVTNKDPSDPANKTYCLDIDEITPTTAATSTPKPTDTPVPTGTPVPGADACEINNSFDTACTIGVDETKTGLNFVPRIGTDTDNDFFRLWVKTGTLYTCETLNLSNVNDTNIIIYDQEFNGLAGNDDKAPGDLSSRVSYRAYYTGWLYILVGPVSIPNYAESFLYTYDLTCTADATPPTATPRPFTGGGGPAVPTNTPTPSEPTPDPVQTFIAQLPTPATPTPPPVVNIDILPTATPLVSSGTGQTVELTVLLYYDANNDFMPGLDEGIMDMAISIYDGVTGELLNFGYTNQAGMLRFNILDSTNLARLEVPFLGYSQTVVVGGVPEVRLRIVPQNLPSGLP